MKKKRKIMAMFAVLLLITIPLSVAEAGETQSNDQGNGNILVELTTIDQNGVRKIEKLFLSEEELTEFKSTISSLIDRIESVENLENIVDIIDSILGDSKLKIFPIITTLLKSLLSNTRAFVISSGHGYKLNPFKKSSIKLRKNFVFWHYSSGKLFKDRTIIVKPLALKLKILKGLQFGFMNRFFGIYIYIARRFPEKSYTFFMGTSKRITGIDPLPNK